MLPGGVFFLGPIPSSDPSASHSDRTPNAPLHKYCCRIPVVVAPVAEAEYAAAFGGAQIGVELRRILSNLGPISAKNQSPPLNTGRGYLFPHLVLGGRDKKAEQDSSQKPQNRPQI